MIRKYIVVCLLLCSCATSNKTMNKVLSNSLIGQNELTVYERLGIPSQTIIHESGNKVWLYQSTGEQLLAGPNTSWHSSTHAEQMGARKAKTFKTKISDLTIRTPDKTAAYELNNDKRYTSGNPFLRIYFDRHGKCIDFKQTMSTEQMKLYQERLNKHSN